MIEKILLRNTDNLKDLLRCFHVKILFIPQKLPFLTKSLRWICQLLRFVMHAFLPLPYLWNLFSQHLRMGLNVAELDVIEKLNVFCLFWLEKEFLKENIRKHNSIITLMAACTITVDGKQQIFLFYQVGLYGHWHTTWENSTILFMFFQH